MQLDLDTIATLFTEVRDDAPDDVEVGELSVLNCTAGDINIKFDKDDAKETENAKRIIQDMLRRGYLLFVVHGRKTERVYGFDPKSCEYLIKESTEVVASDVKTRVARRHKRCSKCSKQIKPGESYLDSKGRVAHVACGIPDKSITRMKRVPMKRVRATGVAPTAGG